METLKKEDHLHEDEVLMRDHHQRSEETSTYFNSFSSLCYNFFNNLVKFVLKCLGFDRQQQASQQHNNEDQEQEQVALPRKINEEINTTLRVSKSPPRSGLGSGSGGQIN